MTRKQGSPCPWPIHLSENTEDTRSNNNNARWWGSRSHGNVQQGKSGVGGGKDCNSRIRDWLIQLSVTIRTTSAYFSWRGEDPFSFISSFYLHIGISSFLSTHSWKQALFRDYKQWLNKGDSGKANKALEMVSFYINAKFSASVRSQLWQELVCFLGHIFSKAPCKENTNTSEKMKQMDSIILKPCEEAIFMIKRIKKHIG